MTSVPTPPYQPHATREGWLKAAAELTGALVSKAAGIPVPPFYVSVGFPKGVRGKGHAVGQCWSGDSSADGACHVFVSPELSTPKAVLPVLLHEQVHATVGCSEKHRGKFAQAMKAAGMVKPWTQSNPGEELAQVLTALAADLGAFPHAALVPAPRGGKGSRLRLWACPCGVKVRVASDDFQAECKKCGGDFEAPV